MVASKTQVVLLLLLLAVSLQLTDAQIPAAICDVIKFAVRILTGCPNVSIQCLILDLIFGIICTASEPIIAADQLPDITQALTKDIHSLGKMSWYAETSAL